MSLPSGRELLLMRELHGALPLLLAVGVGPEDWLGRLWAGLRQGALQHGQGLKRQMR